MKILKSLGHELYLILGTITIFIATVVCFIGAILLIGGLISWI